MGTVAIVTENRKGGAFQPCLKRGEITVVIFFWGGVTNSCHMQENRLGCLIRLPIQRSLAIFNCVLKYQAQGNLSEEQFENMY